MQPHVPGADHKRPPQHGAELPLVKQIQHPDSDAVQVGALVAQGYGPWVGLERVDDLLGQAGREVERQGRFRVVAGGRESQHLGQPEGEGERGAGFEARRVVEVA